MHPRPACISRSLQPGGAVLRPICLLTRRCLPSQNLAYDLTPPDVVNVVITEMGAVPPTSVAVILRESVRDAAVL